MQAPQGLSGVSADFVASLGKKIADARGSLAALEADPASRTVRDDLRRKLHAMGTAARMLRFEGMGRVLAEAEATLDGSGGGALTRKSLTEIAKVLDELPALAWSSHPASPVAAEPRAQAVEPSPAP